MIVAYNSRDDLRGAVEPLLESPDLHIVVVDNASPDRSLEAVVDLDVTTLALDRNGGFAHGCNHGWRLGRAPFVLFLNPDARIEPAAVAILRSVLERNERVGIVAPRVENADGSLAYSQRRFPRLRSTFARAFFLHRLFPRAGWTDELVRDPAAYTLRRPVDWVSGACLLVRRSALERVGGWDEGFFHYGEDIDLCRRAAQAGFEVWFEPAASVRHDGGASGARSALLPRLAESQLRYARKHGGRVFFSMQRFGLALGVVTHVIAGRGGSAVRAGRLGALKVLLTGRPREN